MDLSLERWTAAPPPEREGIARRLARQLPTGFEFDHVQHYQMGNQQHQVARFRRGNTIFSLIPGGPVTLGYDADRSWQPTSDEFESWEGDRGYWFSEGKSIQECVAEVTLRPRRVELDPFLIEAIPEEFGREVIELDDPVVQEICQRGIGFIHELGDTRVSRQGDGSLLAERFHKVKWTHADLTSRLAAEGFRFPTSDEWEYACGAGAPTLFRWGDHVPCDWPDSPTGGYADSPGGFPYGWDPTGEPNAFGLVIAFNSYMNELVAESGLTRGGDGGCSACGGAARFISMMRYATAYFEERFCTYDPAEPIAVRYTIGRRVLVLS